jgi:hypothetical protein
MRDLFDAWAARATPVGILFVPDMVWRVEGTGTISEQDQGRAQFLDEVLPFLAA